MTAVERKRAFSVTLEDIADTLRSLPKLGWSERDIKISERTIWDLKQMAKKIRSTEPLQARAPQRWRKSRAKVPYADRAQRDPRRLTYKQQCKLAADLQAQPRIRKRAERRTVRAVLADAPRAPENFLKDLFKDLGRGPTT